MPELKIEAYYKVDKLGESTQEIFENDQLIVKIFDGETLMAETNLEALVMKFLMVSAEYSKIMAAIGAVKADAGSKIVMPPQPTPPPNYTEGS